MKKPSFNLYLFLAAILTTLFLGSCTINEDDQASPTVSSNPYDEIKGTYRGSATCKIFDPWGNYEGTKTIQYDAILTINRPVSTYDGQVEDNPFNITLSPNSGNGKEGRIFLISGLGVGNSQVQAMMNYWEVSWHNGNINGKLVDTHSANGAVFNLINAYDRWTGVYLPKYIAVGTSLSGDLDLDNAAVKVKGRTTDEGVRFEFTFEAQR